MIKTIFFLFLPVSLFAQFTYVIDQTVAVKVDETTALASPWAGGLNAAHYNTLDLNADAKDDLVLFDRMGDKISTFINEGNKYRYAPEYEDFFPDEITNWLLLRDYNCDGKKDIFTGNILGIKVFMNVSESNENLAWKELSFFTGFPNSKSSVLLTKGFSGKINLQLQFDDLPSITDADGDGDLDIFNVRFAGEGTIEYHKNFSKERYGTCDSLDFERITQKWGNFSECDCAEFAFNNEDCSAIGGRTKHAGGKSLLMLDVNGDASLDVLFSEADCTNLYFLKNEGTVDTPLVNSIVNFPEASPVNFLVFPAAFYEDIDFDERKDLIAVPNIFSKPPEIANANLSHSNWVYKNNGTNEAPDFTYVTDAFLQDEMIDVGDNSVPAFIDYDGDGDQDMFVSYHNAPGELATVRLYENSGSAAAPEFMLVNSDMFGFSTLPYYNLKIQFADINQDSRRDLVFTATSFNTGQTKLYYIPNKSNAALDLSGQAVQETDVFIISSENISVVDVDNDGFQDLLIGKSNGAFQYWRNQRNTIPAFSLQDDTYLGIGANVVSQNIMSTAADLDADGKTDLIYGDQGGLLHIISNFRAATDTTGQLSDIVFNPSTERYQSKNLGGRLWPSVAQIFNTNKPSIVVGNTLGGIYILRHDGGASAPDEPVISVYPNPLFFHESVTIEIDRPATLHILNSLGQSVMAPTDIPGLEKYNLKIPNVSEGLYFLRFISDGRSFTQRLVIARR